MTGRRRVHLICFGVLTVLLVASGCSKSSRETPPTSRPTPSSSTSGPTTSTRAGGTKASTTTTRPAAVATTPTTPVSGGVASHKLPPVGVGERSELANKFFVTVTRIKAQTLAARGPGETSGPGVVVTVEVRNDTRDAIDLSGLAVNAHYGAGVPAVPNRVPGEPLEGVLAPGTHRTGTYEFHIARGAANTVVIDVQHSNAPNVVFVDAAH